MADAIEKILDNPYIRTSLILFFVLYAGLVRPNLPPSAVKLLSNNITRVIVLAVAAYLGNKDPTMSLVIAIAFVVTLNTLAEQKLDEHMSNY